MGPGVGAGVGQVPQIKSMLRPPSKVCVCLCVCLCVCVCVCVCVLGHLTLQNV